MMEMNPVIAERSQNRQKLFGGMLGIKLNGGTRRRQKLGFPGCCFRSTGNHDAAMLQRKENRQPR